MIIRFNFDLEQHICSGKMVNQHFKITMPLWVYLKSGFFHHFSSGMSLGKKIVEASVGPKCVLTAIVNIEASSV